MKDPELSSLTNHLLILQKRAEDIENEVCRLMNDMAAEIIPTTAGMVREAAYQLKNNSFHDMSRGLSAMIDIAHNRFMVK